MTQIIKFKGRIEILRKQSFLNVFLTVGRNVQNVEPYLPVLSITTKTFQATSNRSNCLLNKIFPYFF